MSGLRDRLSRLDPRALQIVALGTFLGFGVLMRDFSVQWQQVGLTFAAALATQAFWLRRLDLRQAGYLSAIVTGFGLSVLVRADSLWAHPMIAALAISSKFVVRIDGRHLFNPANLGAVLAAWLVPGAWLSPGQWGSDLAASAWFLALGAAGIGVEQFLERRLSHAVDATSPGGASLPAPPLRRETARCAIAAPR